MTHMCNMGKYHSQYVSDDDGVLMNESASMTPPYLSSAYYILGWGWWWSAPQQHCVARTISWYQIVYTVVGQSNEWLRTCWPAQLVGLCVVEGRKRARIMYNQLLTISCRLGHNELMIYSTNIIIIRQQNPTFLCLIWSRFCSRTATFVHSLDYYDWYRAYSVYTNSLLYV